MNIHNPNVQKVIGNLTSRDGSKIYKNIQAECKFNQFDLSSSYLSFNINLNRDEYIFELPGGVRFYLEFVKRFDPSYFNISELHIITNKTYKNNKFSSGCVNNLLYFHEKIKYNGFLIKKEQVTPSSGIIRQKYYYTIYSKVIKSVDEADLIFLILSAMSGSKFFTRYFRDTSGKIIIRNYRSSNSSLHTPGSGRLLFPLEFADLYELKNKINPVFLESILLQYTSFCISNNIRERLIMGCGVLDYLLELYLNSQTSILKGGKSKVLFHLLEKVVSDDYDLKQYLKYLFINCPNNIKELKGVKFDFFEYRDRFLHRGELLLSREQISNLKKSVFSLNEIIRIILQNLIILDYSELMNFSIIETNDIEKTIKFRREKISKYW